MSRLIISVHHHNIYRCNPLPSTESFTIILASTAVTPPDSDSLPLFRVWPYSSIRTFLSHRRSIPGLIRWTPTRTLTSSPLAHKLGNPQVLLVDLSPFSPMWRLSLRLRTALQV